MKIIRVLIYEGNERFINSSLNGRWVKGKAVVPNGTVSEMFIPIINEDRQTWDELDHEGRRDDQG